MKERERERERKKKSERMSGPFARKSFLVVLLKESLVSWQWSAGIDLLSDYHSQMKAKKINEHYCIILNSNNVLVPWQ